MSGTRADIVRAEAEAAAARLRIGETVARLRHRLNPAIRARETWEDVRDRGEVVADDALEFAYERPRVVGAAAGTILLFLMRRPLGRLLRKAAFWRRPKWDDAPSPKTLARPPGSLPANGGVKR